MDCWWEYYAFGDATMGEPGSSHYWHIMKAADYLNNYMNSQGNVSLLLYSSRTTLFCTRAALWKSRLRNMLMISSCYLGLLTHWVLNLLSIYEMTWSIYLQYQEIWLIGKLHVFFLQILVQYYSRQELVEICLWWVAAVLKVESRATMYWEDGYND